MADKRIKELDIIKGAGILIITVIHLLYRPQNSAADYFLRAVGWLYISLFFMLAGYSFTAGKRSTGENYLHRIRTLLLPAVIIEAAFFVFGGVYCVFAHGYTFTDWWHDLAVTALRPELCVQFSEEWGHGGVLYENLSPSWFIWSMCFTELAFFPFAKLCIGKPHIRWWLTVGALTAIQIPLYVFVSPISHQLQLIPLFTVFMLIGAKVREAKLLEKEWKFNIPVTAVIVIVCFAAQIGLYLLGGNESYYAGHIGNLGWPDVILTIVQLPVGFVGFYALAKLIMKIKVLADGLIWVGKRTLVILMSHCFFGMVAADMMHTYIKPGPVWYVENIGLTVTPEIFLKSLAGTVIAVVCSIGVAILRDWLVGLRGGTAKTKQK